MRLLRLALVLWPLWALASPGPVVVLSIQGAIGPATADYVHRNLDAAARQSAQLVVLQLDTPGGLDTSMREIIKDILASPVPVASFVAPSGARAASAGTYILYASHLAAMAPATNLGAATPVQIGGMPATPEPERAPAKTDKKGADERARAAPADTLSKKQVHDASAYIRGLAQMRGRNQEWAEKAVREAVSLSAEEALQLKVIDLVAADLAELLKKTDGRRLSALGMEQTLQTADAPITHAGPDWRSRVLAVLTDPSIAYILMLVGIYGLFYEFSNPGYVLPGVAGTIALLIALYAFHLLPLSYAGLALILLGIGFMVAEGFVPAYGSLGIGGAIAFAIGSVMLIDTDSPGYGLPLPLVLGVAAASALFLAFVVGIALKGRARPVVSGREEMIGSAGEVLENCEHDGWARVHGENWRIRSARPLRAGERIRVQAMDGLVLEVGPDPAPNQGE